MRPFSKPSRMLGACALLSACAAGASVAAPGDRDTPRAVYDREVGCAAIAAAAVDHVHLDTVPQQGERADAREVLSITRARAERSGAALGMTPNDVSRGIEEGKGRFLTRLESGTPEARKAEEETLGGVLVKCALVAALERKAER